MTNITRALVTIGGKEVRTVFSNKAKAKMRDGDEYVKARDAALADATESDVVIRYHAKKGEKVYHGNYIIPTEADLDGLIAEEKDLHMQEALREQRKPFHVVTFSGTDEDAETKMNAARKCISRVLESLGSPAGKKNVFMQCKKKAIDETHEGIYTYTIIVNNGTHFGSLRAYQKYHRLVEIEALETFPVLTCDDGTVFDGKACGKEFTLPLPHQCLEGFTFGMRSKIKSLSSVLVSHGLRDSTAIDEERLSELLKKKAVDPSEFNLPRHLCNPSLLDTFGREVLALKKRGVNVVTVMGTMTYDKYGTYARQYVLSLIYNGSASKQTLSKVACAIKRGDESEEMFLNWAKDCQDDDTLKEIWESARDDMWGFPTLLTMACICCPAFREQLIREKFKSSLAMTYVDEALEGKKTIVDKQFLTVADVDLRNNDIVFVKSPMGTGKSYLLHELFNEDEEEEALPRFCNQREKRYKYAIYLSSRQAFSHTMAHEFHKDGFVNYLSDKFTGREERIIVSLESLHRVNDKAIQECQLLIIDESESIFDIFSSRTLLDNEYEKNMSIFHGLLMGACDRRKVLVMDAFLSNKSLIGVNKLLERNAEPYERVKSRRALLMNEYKHAQRTCHKVGRDRLIHELREKVRESKRCVLVTGSKQLGVDAIAECKKAVPDLNVIFYHANNPLSGTTDVNEAWSTCQLLVYTPTITCGISYTNKDARFDNLFIYTVNKGSCHVRDSVQAMRRVREFTNDVVWLCINANFHGHSKVGTPTDYHSCKDGLIRYREPHIERLSDIIRIQDDEKLKDWVLFVMAHNAMEANQSATYMRDVWDTFLGLENIAVVDAPLLADEVTEVVKGSDDWKYDEIEAINEETYRNIEGSMGVVPIAEDDIKQFYKYIFDKRVRDDVDAAEKQVLFDAWHSREMRSKMDNIRAFRRMLAIRIDTWEHEQTCKNSTDVAIKQRVLVFRTMLELLRATGIVDESGKLNMSKTFTNKCFTPLLEQKYYKELTLKSINGLLSEGRMKNWELREECLFCLLNNLLKDCLGYQVKGTGKRTRLNGTLLALKSLSVDTGRNKKKDEERPCILSKLTETWENL